MTTTPTTPPTTRTPARGRDKTEPDAVCAAAVDEARAAAVTEAGTADLVGDHLGVLAEGERVATHLFAALHPGYHGWRWAVTLARASRARTVTVDEVVLLPGVSAITAGGWVPWSERVQPGDLGPGDLHPTPADDPRLTAGFTETGAPDDVRAVVDELGLGRERVLTPFGRDDAAIRWYAGDHGPGSPVAEQATYACHDCGYYVALSGSLGAAFGACTNEMSPGDGAVVAFDYGCGAHSSVVVEAEQHVLAQEPRIDTVGYDELDPE